MADKIMTIPEMLQHRAEHDADTKVFSFYDRNGLVGTLEPHEIYTLAGKFAFCLREWGFQQGDGIACGLPNSPERIVSDMGVILAGCVLSNFQVVEKDGSDFWNTAKHSQCRGLIVPNRKESETYQLVAFALPDNSFNSGIYDVSISQAPNIRKIILCDRRENDAANSFLDFLRSRSDEDSLHASCKSSDYAVLFSTSGSSGFSKLIPKTHRDILESGRRFKAAEGALYFSDRPMGWVGGFPYEFLAFAGRKVTQDQFDQRQATKPDALWNIISSAGCTGAALLPGAVYELVDHFRNQPPEFKLQFITSSGQAIKQELMNAIGVLCHAVVVAYGSTEGGVFSADAITNASEFKDFYSGKVLSDVQVQVVGGNGEPVNNGAEGEIYIKCDRLVKRYYTSNPADSTSTSGSGLQSDLYTPDGWFKTGDRGILHDDKSLYCFGRSGDVISLGATIVYLSWPENILNKCPEVQNSSIVGVDEDSNGNGNVKLCACVIPKIGREDLTEREVIEFFDDAMISPNNTFPLRLSHVFVMDALPLLPTGKVHKRELKRIVVDILKAL